MSGAAADEALDFLENLPPPSIVDLIEEKRDRRKARIGYSYLQEPDGTDMAGRGLLGEEENGK